MQIFAGGVHEEGASNDSEFVENGNFQYVRYFVRSCTLYRYKASIIISYYLVPRRLLTDSKILDLE